MPTHFTNLFGAPDAMGGAGSGLPTHAVGVQDWCASVEDFHDIIDQTSNWTVTAITGGTAGGVASNTGILRLDSPAQNQGPIVQWVAAGATLTGILPTAASSTALASEAVMVARFALRDADAMDCFVGFAEINSGSAVLTSAGALTSDTHAGFHCVLADGGAMDITVAGDDDTAAVRSTNTVFTLTDDQMIEVAVRVVGTRNAFFYYRKRGLAGTVTPPSWRLSEHRKGWIYAGGLTTATAWDARMYPTIACVGDAAGDDLDLDYVVYSAMRDLTI